MMPTPISPDRLTDRSFRIKRLQYNLYEVENANVTGQLRLITIPVNILEVPEHMLPQGVVRAEPVFAINSQSIVGFTNRGRKLEPSAVIVNQQQIQAARKLDLTPSIQEGQYEPWNEFVVQGDPPVVIKARTILTKLEWLRDYTSPLGDPFLWAQHSTTNSVSIASAGEAGLT